MTPRVVLRDTLGFKHTRSFGKSFPGRLTQALRPREITRCLGMKQEVMMGRDEAGAASAEPGVIAECWSRRTLQGSAGRTAVSPAQGLGPREGKAHAPSDSLDSAPSWAQLHLETLLAWALTSAFLFSMASCSG